MVLIVTLQIDLNYSYRYCKSSNINPKRSSKVKRRKVRALYYSKSVKCFNIIRSGDIAKYPGLGSHPVKCDTCEKTICSNSKKTYCTVCRNVTHLNCITSNKKTLSNLTQDWMCSTCIQSTLSFSKVRDLLVLDSSSINEAVEYQDQHINMLYKHRCYTSVAHINTQSLPSFFDEFSLMMNWYQFDIAAVSETWLKDNKTQLEYLQINGYSSVWKNRESKTGGGVGFYIKEHMSVKVRQDLGKIDESIETLWIELRGRNKNTPFLTGVVYQPSSNETEKLVWLEKFEHILSEVYTKWNGVI